MAELVAPAGNLEKLSFALHYGADAVYAGAEDFSLRARADNFSYEEIHTAVEYTHQQGKKFFLAVNTAFRDSMLEALPAFLAEVVSAGPDALIVSDLGALNLIRELYPDMRVHISTQANTMNARAAKVYASLGASRVVLARELSLDDIRRFRDACPEMELEAFVHGAMCVAYSGRCLISNYMTHKAFGSDAQQERIANHGDCSHTCRWEYTIHEKIRGKEVYTVEDGSEWSQIFASKDLCMVQHLGDLLDAGVDCFKIEGRMKSVLYTANTARVYRHALSAFEQGNPDPWRDVWQDELQGLNAREHTTGFYYPEDRSALLPASGFNMRLFQFLGSVLEREGDCVRCISSNRIDAGDTLQCIGPAMKELDAFAFELLDEHRQPAAYLGHGKTFFLRTDADLKPDDILRTRRDG